MFNSDDTAHNARCRGSVVTVTTVAAEPQQQQQNGQEEQTRQSYDGDQPRVVKVYDTITHMYTHTR